MCRPTMFRILFTNGILGIDNVGGDLNAVPRQTRDIRIFPWDRGDGCIIRLVAIVDKAQNYRIEKGEHFAGARPKKKNKK